MPRQKPFSSKQKKFQLQDKRQRKKESSHDGSDPEEAIHKRRDRSQPQQNLRRGKLGAVPDRRTNPHRYCLQFFKESNEEIDRRKTLARRPLREIPEDALEVDIDQVYQPGSVLDLPKRPPWNYSLSRAELEAREQKYFQEYTEAITEKFPPEQLSYFEMNLETWRQLWRVLEMSDILLLILDIRYPVLHMSPALYHTVTHDLGKSIIIILNKVDLAPPPLVIAWKSFLQQKYEKVHIVLFTSYPNEALTEGGDEIKAKLRRKRGGGAWTRAMGQGQLLEVCQNIVGDKVDLSSWHDKLVSADAMKEEEDTEDSSVVRSQYEDTSYKHEETTRYQNGVLTIGCVGYPNVGKSSLLNGLIGKKVVSVSRTPGHTKHFQTIFLTQTIKLCDCPGLVFPSLIDKSLQILAGIYPIAQVREPFTPVGFLAERIDILNQLRLKHPNCEKNAAKSLKCWSAYDICEAWAEKRGFITAKSGRPDLHRAANNLLRMGLDGRLCLCLRPPGYTDNKGHWERHQETLKLIGDLECYRVNGMSDGEDEFSDEDLAHLGRENDSDDEEESEGEDEENEDGSKYVSNNPFALLGGDD
ncbi:guanine nucleotide-binding protein-like 1 [Mizuhopecten yessoensis]|uniref:Guanine nucleotide-binding protein-like 1 n=1 Tax=Mizuhopecten yessoensis TaxID=6573 RepID=A0A210PSP7_MIZYE|nr:guanine nucleotide-binding protein-like 1 [Mizuhopecten yessoensis]OWF39484.1 Guanine nucleotide-binding protein-like 1 [Mizuhopecten yessoensis]